MTDALFDEIDRIFHPRSMASVGVSDRMENMGKGFLIGFRKQGFAGRLYAVNPNRKIEDFDSAASLLDIEGPVDYVKVTVSSRHVVDVIRDCGRKGVRCATIFTSGFRESGTEEGARLEAEVLNIAREGGVRLIGPNCMGLHYPDGA
jgi:acetate---CoA ligase (ADP-forming)